MTITLIGPSPTCRCQIIDPPPISPAALFAQAGRHQHRYPFFDVGGNEISELLGAAPERVDSLRLQRDGHSLGSQRRVCRNGELVDDVRRCPGWREKADPDAGVKAEHAGL